MTMTDQSPENPAEIPAEIVVPEPGTDVHDHGDGPHSHDEPDNRELAFTPQPVPQAFDTGVVQLANGQFQILVTFRSVNGSWSVFMPIDVAMEHGQRLIGLAYQAGQQGAAQDPPQAPEDPEGGATVPSDVPPPAPAPLVAVEAVPEPVDDLGAAALTP